MEPGFANRHSQTACTGFHSAATLATGAARCGLQFAGRFIMRKGEGERLARLNRSSQEALGLN
jgi:hypothetical protein